MGGIYKIINKVNGKYYVGSTTSFNKRWTDHKRYLNKNNHKNDYLQNAWNKHGQDNFDFIIVENNISNEKLLLIEQKYLDIAYQEKNCYNICFTAGKVEFTNEIRKKISDANKGRKLWSLEDKKRIGKFRKGKTPWIKGKHHTDETRKKISQICKGKNTGESAYQYDNTIYKFYNKITSETFEGTRYNFCKSFTNLDKRKVHELVHGTRKSHKDWKLISFISFA